MSETITVKVKKTVHKDVKIYCAQKDISIEDFYTSAAKSKLHRMRMTDDLMNRGITASPLRTAPNGTKQVKAKKK